MNEKPVYYDEEQRKEILEFITDQWGDDGDGFVCHEIKSDFVHTDIKAIGREGARKVFVTFGAGARKMNAPFPDRSRIELVMYCSEKMSIAEDLKDFGRCSALCAELASLSKYPFRKDTWLGLGHTVNATENFVEEFGYGYFLFAEHVEKAHLSGIGDVRFLIAIPVFKEEKDWMASHENGSVRFLIAYYETFQRGGNTDEMFLIDVDRPLIIPPGNE